MTSLELRNISATSKTGAKLRNISLKVEEGDYIVLLGPTGSGPTEVLQVIAGLLKVDSGEILLNGREITDLPPEDRNVSMVFEQFNLFPHMSVLDNLLYSARVRREDIAQKEKVAEEIISMVRLDGREDAISRELSGGMQQRVGVARAVVASSEILLLDQPYRALDAKIRAELRMEVRNIVKGLNLSCVHSTHETEEAMLVADKVAIFKDGHLEQFGTPEEIFDNPATAFVASFLAESNNWDVREMGEKVRISEQVALDYDRENYSGDYSKVIIRQHAIDLFFDEDPPEGWSSYEGTITKIRLLGESIRITVRVGDVDFIVRELINPNLRTVDRLEGQRVVLGFPVEEVRLY